MRFLIYISLLCLTLGCQDSMLPLLEIHQTLDSELSDMEKENYRRFDRIRHEVDNMGNRPKDVVVLEEAKEFMRQKKEILMLLEDTETKLYDSFESITDFDQGYEPAVKDIKQLFVIINKLEENDMLSEPVLPVGFELKDNTSAIMVLLQLDHIKLAVERYSYKYLNKMIYRVGDEIDSHTLLDIHFESDLIQEGEPFRANIVGFKTANLDTTNIELLVNGMTTDYQLNKGAIEFDIPTNGFKIGKNEVPYEVVFHLYDTTLKYPLLAEFEVKELCGK